MPKIMNPEGVRAPAGYAHVATVKSGAEWLTMAGQIGVDLDGNVPEDFRAQAEQAFRNVVTCLTENGFGREHIVKLSIFLTNPDDIVEMRAARKAVLGDDLFVPSTLLIVAGLATPALHIEVEATAAKD